MLAFKKKKKNKVKYDCCPARIYKKKKKFSHGCRHVGTFKIKRPDIVVVLLAYLKIHIWLMSCWYKKSPDMVVILLAYLKVHLWLMSYWHIKSPDMVDVLQAHKKIHTWLLSCWHFLKAKLVALSLLALSKGQTCGSNTVGPFLRPNLWL